MAVSSAELALRFREQERWREQGRQRPKSLDRPLPPHPLFDALSPLAPRLPESSFPSHLYLPMFKPHLEDLADLGKPQPAEDNLVFIDPKAQEDDGVEVGRNFYRMPYDRRGFPSSVVWGTPDSIPGLPEDLYALIDRGLLPVASKHRHPKLYLPLLSPDDATNALQRGYEGTESPTVKEITIVGDGVQVMGIVTARSHSIVEDRDLPGFVREWKERYRQAEDKDQVSIDLADHMRLALYMSTDNVNFHRATPLEVVRQVRQMPAYQQRMAA